LSAINAAFVPRAYAHAWSSGYAAASRRSAARATSGRDAFVMSDCYEGLKHRKGHAYEDALR
jgi:hypothetical protein